MVILLNGSFGIGKTTVARVLVRELPSSVLFDPEPLGLVLSRLSLFGPKTDDFQDLAVWREVSIRLIRLTRRFRRTVVVPMAFSNDAYLRQFLAGIGRAEQQLFHFCLVAPIATVRERLNRRAPRHGPTAWQLRRAAECCDAHQRAEFAVQVPTEGRSPQDVARELLARIRSHRLTAEQAPEREVAR